MSEIPPIDPFAIPPVRPTERPSGPEAMAPKDLASKFRNSIDEFALLLGNIKDSDPEDSMKLKEMQSLIQNLHTYATQATGGICTGCSELKAQLER